MKKIFLVLFLVALSAWSHAQLDRSKRPLPGPAPEIKLSDPATFELANGLKVFVVQNNKLPSIAVSLVLNNDPIMEGNAVGFVDMTGELIRTGTKNKQKAEIDAYIDQIGASVSTSASGFYASSLSKYKNELFGILSELVLETEFRQEELDRLKKQTISGLQTEKDDANAIAGNVRKALVYGKNHPYGQITTEKTVENITLELCRNYFKTYYRPNVGYLALVGDITVEDARKLVEKAFGAWQKAEVPKQQYLTPAPPARTRVVVVDRPVAVQTVINIAYPVQLKPGATDAIAASVMNTLLGGGDARLFNNLREKYGFTYGAYSNLSRNNLVGQFNAYAQVRTAVTDSSVMQFLYELNRVRDSIAPAKEVQGILSYLNGSFAIGLQSPQTIASYAIDIERYGMPKDYYRNYLKTLAGITPADVQAAAQKYVQPGQAYIICVGNAKSIAESLAKYAASGKVEMLDMYGNEVKAPSKPLPAGLTAQKVIDNYIVATGGIKAWNKVKNIDITMSASMQNMTLAMQVRKMRPNMFESKMTLNGAMVIQQVKFDGEKAFESGMQAPGNKEVDGARLAELKEGADLLPEANYNTPGYQLNLLGIEMVNDIETYAIEVTFPSGSKQTEYYDVASGFKVREMSVEDSPEGSVVQTSDLADYRKVKGNVLVPHKATIQFGPRSLTMEIKSIIVNGKMKAAEFKP